VQKCIQNTKSLLQQNGNACARAEADALVLADGLLAAARQLYAESPADATAGSQELTGLCDGTKSGQGLEGSVHDTDSATVQSECSYQYVGISQQVELR
jgi:hypothetical protein